MKVHRFLALIPAKKTSTRLPGKNLKEINGLSLTARAIICAKAISRLEKIVVSSDCHDILFDAKTVGGDDHRVTYHHRPMSMALSTSSIEPLLLALMERNDWATHCVLLNPTSPFRQPGTVDRCISAITKLGFDSSATVKKTTSHHYIWSKSGDDFTPPFAGKKSRPRSQDLTPGLREHGACFVTSRSLLKRGVLIGDRCYPVVTGVVQSIDIDTSIDLDLARAIASSKNLLVR